MVHSTLSMSLYCIVPMSVSLAGVLCVICRIVYILLLTELDCNITAGCCTCDMGLHLLALRGA